MLRNAIKSAALAIAVSTMTLVGAGAATAETSSVPRSGDVAVTADGGYQVRAPEVSYTFNHDQSEALYNAAKAGGVAAAAAACARFGPAAVVCGIVAAYIIDTISDPPADNECYQVYPRIGNPPIGVRTVTC